MKKQYGTPSVCSHEVVTFETAVSGSKSPAQYTWIDPTGDDYFQQTSSGYTLVDPTNDDTFSQS